MAAVASAAWPSRRNITHCRLLRRILQIQFGWEASRFNSQWTQIDVMFSARLRSDTGWLTWGVNPLPHPRMIGSQSVGIYDVTSGTKKGCRLLPSALDIEVPHYTLDYNEREDMFMISAKVIVPNSKYNILKLNHVWEVGYEAVGVESKMHPKVLQDFKSAEALNLLTEEEEDVAYKNHQAHLKKVRGILNVDGWAPSCRSELSSRGRGGSGSIFWSDPAGSFGLATESRIQSTDPNPSGDLSRPNQPRSAQVG